MTFIAPTPTVRAFGSTLHPGRMVRATKTASRGGLVEQDGARQAFGSDPALPMPVVPGSPLEHLARIALG